MLVSKKEFAMPLQIIRIYASAVFVVKVMPIKKMAKNTTPTNALSRLHIYRRRGLQTERQLTAPDRQPQ